MSSIETVEQTVSINGKTVIIYNNRKPDSYLYSDIFDPDNPVSGKYFPSLYSIVIKDDGSLWYVSARNETTFKVTLSPCNIISQEDTDNTVQIVSYGNERYCLYQDTRVSPYKLVVDAKVLFYGTSLKEYTLSHADDNGNEEIISMYLDATDTFVSDRIPMAPISANMNAYKFPTNCHTTVNLVEGDTVTLRVYNNLGNLAAQLTLFVRNAVWLNDLKSITNPIVELGMSCLQERGNDFYIKERQDPSHLNIQPYLVYSDGTRINVNIDNSKCFLYGLDDFIPSYPGYSQTIMCKYFLGRNESATDPTSANNTAYLTCTKKLVVTKEKEDYSTKISVVPIYSQTSGKWYLRYFAYIDDRDGCYDVTDSCTTSEFNFDGSTAMWGTTQHVVVDYDLSKVLNLGSELPGSQSFYITVWDPNIYERYTIKANIDSDHVYGSDGSVVRRPVLNYDADEKVYFIPTSIFRNQDSVVESFYTLADPYFDTRTETEPPTPTHFIIRDALNGKLLHSTPVALKEYGTAIHFVDDSTYTNQTVLVEFLQLVQDTYVILYGVPVDVKLGTFNDEDSD